MYIVVIRRNALVLMEVLLSCPHQLNIIQSTIHFLILNHLLSNLHIVYKFIVLYAVHLLVEVVGVHC